MRMSILCPVVLIHKTLMATFVFFSFAISAQNIFKYNYAYPTRHTKPTPETRRQIDSLIQLTIHHPPDSDLVLAYYKLSILFHPSGSDSTLLFAHNSYELSNKLNYVRGIMFSCSAIGDYYGTMGNGQLDKALTNYLTMAAIAEGQNWTEEIYDSYNTINNLYFYMGDFPAAMHLSLKGLAMSEKRSDTMKVAYYKNLLGFIYHRQGNMPVAKQYYQEYFVESSWVKDSVKMYDAQIGLAEILLEEGKPDEALQLLQSSLEYLEKAYAKKIYGFMKSEKIPYAQFAMAKVFISKGEYEKALEHCRKGFDVFKIEGINEYDLANYYITTGEAYEGLNQQAMAIEAYREGLNLALRIKHAEDIRDAYGSLARVFADQKKFDSAYRYVQFYNQMKDSITNVRTRSEIQRINAEYDEAKKDREIEQQKSLHEVEIERQALIRNSIIVGVLFIGIISFLVYTRYRLKEQHKFQQQLSSQRTELLGNFINAQTTERTRLALDIHDQVGTMLSAAKLKLSDLEDSIESREKEKLTSSLSMLDQAAESLRNISHNLMPASLSRLGLVVALEHFFDQLNRVSALKIAFSAFNFKERLPETLEANLYPIVLELANNAIRHAQGKNLNIQIIRYPDKVNITVEDDGIGFDYEKKKESISGLGLAGIESRIEILNGLFNLDSALGRGTVAVVDVPV